MDLLRRLREEAIKATQRGKRPLTAPRRDILPFQQQRRQVGQTLTNRTRQAVQPAVNYFDPTKSTNQNPGFWSDKNPVAQFMAKPQNYRIPIAKTFQATPRGGVGSFIGAGAQNLALGAVDEIVNIPQRFLEGGNRFASIKRDNAWGDTARVVGAGAGVISPFVDTVTLGGGTVIKGLGTQAIKQGAKQGLKQAIKTQAIKGGLAGAGYGMLYGAQEGDRANLENIAKGGTFGALFGAGLGAGGATIGGLSGLLKKTPQVEQQLRDKGGRWTAGQTPVKPKGMTNPQWEYQLQFNKKYGRNPYTPVYHDDVIKAASYEVEKKGTGLSIRDVSKDSNPLGQPQARMKDIKEMTIKTADGKNEFVAQLGETVYDRAGRKTGGFHAVKTSPNFKSRNELNAWIKTNINKSEPNVAKPLLSDIDPKMQPLIDKVKTLSPEQINLLDDPKTNFEILPKSYLKTPKKLYRGEQAMTGFGTGSGVEGFGLYTTTDKAVAQGYAKISPGGVLREMNPSTDIPKNPLYFRGPAEMRSWKDRIANQFGVRPAEFDSKYGGFNEVLNLLGYDGAAFDLGNGVAFVKYPKAGIPREKLLNASSPLPQGAGNALLKPKEAQQLTPEVNQAVEQVGQRLKLKQEPIGGIVSEATPKTLDKVRIRTQQAKAKQAQNEFNEWQKQVFARESATRTTGGAVRDASKAVKTNTRSMAAQDITDLKDISSPATQLVDVFRNFRKVYGKKYEDVKKVVLDPLFVKGKTDLLNDQEMWIKRISKEVEGDFGIKKGSKQSADVQKFGEGLIDEAGLVSKYGRKGASTIVEADKWFRKNYDQLLDEVNAVRAKIYPNNPDKIIPKRKDYYRHFNELSQGIDGLLNTLGRAVDVSPQLAGISYKTKPKSKWLSFAQRRVGGKTEFDAVGGFIDYVKAQTYAKHIDPHIDTFRQLSRELGEAGVEQNKGLNNFSLFLEKFADDLSGKTGTLDRAIQEIGGRKPMAVLNWVNQRVKANVILGNASSSVAQFFNLPNGIADAGPQFAAKGFARAVGSMFKKNRPQDQSVFLRERYFRGFEKFDRSMIDNGRKFAAWMITAGDEISTKAMWNMQYEKGLAQGLRGQALINQADDITRSMVAGRGIGEMALIQRSKAFQLFAPFQVEVTNAWYVIGDMIGEKAFGKLATLALTSYIMNRAAEQVRGSDVSFDPVQAVAEGIEAFNEEDDKKVGALRLAGRVGGEFLSNIPVGQTAAAAYPEYGFKVGEFEAPTREDFFGEGDPTRFGSGLLATKALQDPLFMAVPPYAGQQLKRTIDGISTSIKGYSETPGGDIRFPVNNSPVRDVQRAIFGQYSTPEAREYFDKDRRKLGSNQSEIFKSLEGTDRENYYQTTMSNREKENAIDKLKEEVKVSGASTSVGDTFVYYDQDSGEARTLDVSKFREEPEGALARAKWDNDRWDKAKEIFNSPLENKNEIIESIGLDPADVEYFDFASQDNDVKSMVIREEMAGMTNRQQLLQKLVEFRREVNGKIVLTSGVIDDLEDEGIISDAEAKQLKKIEFGKDGSPKVKVSGRGKGAKLKGVKISDVKNVMKETKIDSKIDRINTQMFSPQFTQPDLDFKVPSLGVGGGGTIPQLPNFKIKFNL